MKLQIIYGPKGAKQFYIGGKEVTAEQFAKIAPNRIEDLLKSRIMLASATPGAWPMRSEALAVHPDEVQMANERNHKAGLATTYDSDGIAIIPTREERRKLLRAEGLHDKHAGYGD
jgi:hypothetical protein